VKRKIELLAPGGSIDSIKAAVVAGADAIYCGLDKFNARNRASNLNFDDLQAVLLMAHDRNCQIFVTINIIIVENEIPALINLLNKLINTSIDAIIVQDLGLFYIVKKYFPNFNVHASTQCTTHNIGQIEFLAKLNSSRVNLSRELNITEIKKMSKFAQKKNIHTEVFVHGSNCLSFSGLCYMSSVISGNSGNRGRCSQPCRDEFKLTKQNKKHPLNIKDNSAFSNIEDLYNAGVDSFKIEGRIKKFDYVYTVVDVWRKHIDNLYIDKNIDCSNENLYKVFNRDLSNSFLTGDLGKHMFIDNPRDNSVLRLSQIQNYSSREKLNSDRDILFEQKDVLRKLAENKIKNLYVAKEGISLMFSGNIGESMQLVVETLTERFVIYSKIILNKSENALSEDVLFKRFKAIDETEYYLDSIDMSMLEDHSFLSYTEITRMKNQVLFLLNNSRENVKAVELPSFPCKSEKVDITYLSIIISEEKDVYLSDNLSLKVYFQIPESLKSSYNEIERILLENENLIPWFPSVIIGDDYILAKTLLLKFSKRIVVINNTGIAFDAYENNIHWIAGPYLNNINSYSLLCLKEEFNCSGAFISNEINKDQMKKIKCPENFNLYYSIYHPLVLLTSRQCLFHQVDSCGKTKGDDMCLSTCDKKSYISKENGDTLFLNKKAGDHHRIYNDENYLNTKVIDDKQDFFTSYFIDLRDIQSNTDCDLSKQDMVNCFTDLIQGKESAKELIDNKIKNINNKQYYKGI